MSEVTRQQWSTLFETVDKTEAAADLLQYSTVWRTPDGTAKLPPLSLPQAQLAVDTVFCFLNDRINGVSGGPGENF